MHEYVTILMQNEAIGAATASGGRCAPMASFLARIITPRMNIKSRCIVCHPRHKDSRKFHQTLPYLGLILGLRMSSVPYPKTLGRTEPIPSYGDSLVLTRDRTHPSIS